MDFDQPEVWTVQFQVNYFVLSLLLYLYFLDFVLYEYSSFSSSQEFFLHFGIWKNHSKISSFQSYFGDQKTQLNLGLNNPYWPSLSRSWGHHSSTSFVSSALFLSSSTTSTRRGVVGGHSGLQASRVANNQSLSRSLVM